MLVENATTQDQNGRAAISQQEMDERNFGLPMTETEGDDATDSSNRQSTHSSNDEEIPEKLRGKSSSEIARSIAEAERKMHEATEAQRRSEETARSYQAQLSRETEARIRYERLLEERNSQKEQPVDTIRQEFKTKVNDSDEVLNTVERLVDARIDSKTPKQEVHDDEDTQVTLFNIQLQQKFLAEPDLVNIYPEIQNVAANRLAFLREDLLRTGVSQKHVDRHLNRMNRNMEFLDSCKREVIGAKGKDYWAQNKSDTSAADDEAKLQLGGGSSGSNADGGETSSKSLLKLASKPGGSKEMREALVKAGALRPK